MEGYLLYPGLCTRFHRMVTANGPSPDTYILVFISAGSLYKFLYLFLSSSSVRIQIGMHIIERNCDYDLTISHYKIQTVLIYNIVHMLISEISFKIIIYGKIAIGCFNCTKNHYIKQYLGNRNFHKFD